MQYTIDHPESYICPIGHDLMNQPMVDYEGNTYDRANIYEWLSRNNTSPITRNPLAVNQLFPNRALKDAINEYKIKKGIPITSNSVTPDIGRDIDLSEFSLDLNKYENVNLISIIPPKGKDRQAGDICAVVDISGSMGVEATIKNNNGQQESHGLSILDVTKHALRTIVYCLDMDDRFALISYSNSARVEFQLNYMTVENKQKAINCINNLHTEGSTNLWDGLFKGMEELKKSKGSGRNAGVFLLTDGQPNIEPPRGHIPMLKKYKDENPDLIFTIDTYGFGYNLDSDLLNQISINGNGSYAFIPDSGFVGTVFEHSISNFLSNISTSSILSIELENGDQHIINDINYPFEINSTSWGSQINVGPIQYGQNKNIVVITNSPNDNFSVTWKYLDSRDNNWKTISKNIFSNNQNLVLSNYYRTIFAKEVNKALDTQDKDIISNLSVLISNSPVKNNPYIIDLLKDINGQVSEALSRNDWFHKWGKHYLPSLISSHYLEKCNNFKDPGVQHFGGDLFRKIRDKADDIFCNMDPPKPSITHGSSRTHSSRRTSAPVNMSVYSQPSGICFDGSCEVLMFDKSTKLVQDIVKGDEVITPNNCKATVRCVIKTITTNGIENLVMFEDGLLITKWHPVRINGEWKFPGNICRASERTCPAVYSFLLETDDEHVIIINNIECITLAHNIDVPVAKHKYFGTNEIIYDLEKMQGWDTGLITINKNNVIRDEITNRVIKINN